MLQVNKALIIGAINIGLNLIKHPDLNSAAKVLESVRNDIQEHLPEAQVATMALRAFVPDYAGTANALVSDAGLLGQLAQGVANLLQNPSSANITQDRPPKIDGPGIQNSGSGDGT